MKQVDKILRICSDQETSLKDIADMLGWSKGAASVSIHQLISNGLLIKTRYGFYSATAQGRKKIRNIIKEQHEPGDDIDSVIRWTAADFTADSSFSTIKTLKYGIEGIRPSTNTKELAGILKDIYLETISPTHRNDYDLAKSMWWNHRGPKCESCEFDFERGYDVYVEEIEKIATKIHPAYELSKSNVFRKLRWYSFPDSERTRKNFGWVTKYTEPKIPDDWK